jgi:hypothetical protein
MSKNTVKINPGMTISHLAHSQGRQHEHDSHVEAGAKRSYSGGIDPRVGGKPKHQNVVPVHGAMTRQVQGKTLIGSGHDASALDSMSGAIVPEGGSKSVPGWGNALARAGNPLVRAPGSKVTAKPAIAFGMRNSSARGSHDLDLGEAVLREAFAAGDRMDRAAHGRKEDGSKR